MKILLVGASGFIGSAIAHALLADGHDIRAVGRDLAYGRRILPAAHWLSCDLRSMTQAADWMPLLEGIEVAINASGALQGGLRDDLVAAQDRAIRALAEACVAAGTAHLVQISAASADEQDSEFMQTKARADAAVAAAGVPCTVLRPGLVIGRNCFGGSELLRSAAAMPLARIELPAAGQVQCVALADVIEAVRRVIADPQGALGRFDLVEREGRSLGEVIACHRRWLGFGPARLTLNLPLALLRPATLAADALGWLGWRSPLRSNSIAALVFGVRGDASQAAALLGREPLSLPAALDALGGAGKADRWHARLALLYPLALAALFVLWLAGGATGLARTDAAASLLVAGGFSERLARAFVLLGSFADLAIAAALLFRPTLRIGLGTGAALALAYGLGAALVRPDLWLDPLGAFVKILPIVVLSLMCLAMGEER
ncbi:NAD(P)H-binding protein [Altererythrobacter salegens]|uniref:NAD(P)H-binding protein n=1 Tax=Croceibacterium salegens TaxID=1737568 RepID=A0A6I4SY90_9SPHN|nr:SDR family oxidoreductase [Croceibacterium salegens]MXO60329.1 NAD(P)H-binding protein [Croceibacterium salegens]